MSKTEFSQMAETQMPKYIKKSIDDLLDVMNSDIIYPTDRDGSVIEHRLLKVVQSREQVCKSIFKLMDFVEINQSNDDIYKEKLIIGFKKTWEQLVAITIRDIPREAFTVTEDEDEDEDDAQMNYASSDDHLSNIAKSKEVSAEIAMSIMKRISSLENPEMENKRRLDELNTVNIIEMYAED